MLYEQALKLKARHPDALHLLGQVALQSGDAAAATTLLEQATRAQPRNPAFHADLAQAHLASQRAADARAAFQRAAQLDPRNPQFAVGAAICLAMQGGAAEAEQQLRNVAQRHPDYPLAWFNLGNVLRDQGRPEEAANMYRRAIRLDPAFADAHNNLGRILHEGDRFDDAEQAYRQHVALQPDSAVGYFNLASLLIDRGRTPEAIQVCRQGLGRFTGSAASPELQWMLGCALAQRGEFTSCLVAYQAAVALAPNSARALWGYAFALLHSANEQEGLRWLEQALELQPDSPELRYSSAGVYLSLGDLQAGWREYHWRPARSAWVGRFPGLRLERELPGDGSGRKICLLSEQGLGDELLFLRFAPALKLRGAQITYRAGAKIASMLKRVPALDQVITEDAPLPVADFAALVGDLPWMLGKLDASPYPRPTASRGTPRAATTSEDKREKPLNQRLPRVFYPEVPPPLVLAPLPGRLEEMKQRLSGLGPPPYLGLTWRAGTAPEHQRGPDWVLHKEIPLKRLGAAVRGVNGSLIALQRNPQPGELDELSGHAARPVHDLTALNEELEAMLALLALIDDYIGVSNTNMHVRAGVGRTARVLVPRPAEWPWMISGNESPWFPGFRIYRQDPDGDWSALTRLQSDLLTAFGSCR